jgi:hypothetical protein
MRDTALPYIVLLVALVFGVMQATLDRVGVGRTEWLRDSLGSLILNLVSIPLNLLSNIGLIAICVWSFFVLNWLPTAGIVATGIVVWGWTWGSFLARFRRSESWDSVLEIGISLLLFLKIVTAGSVVFLAWTYIR